MEEKGECIFSVKTIYRMSDFQIECYLEHNLLAIRTCCCLYFLASPVASLCECLPLWSGTQPWLCPISCRWKWQRAISSTGLQLTSFYLPSYVSTIIMKSMFSSHRCPFSLSQRKPRERIWAHRTFTWGWITPADLPQEAISPQTPQAESISAPTEPNNKDTFLKFLNNTKDKELLWFVSSILLRSLSC